MKKRLLMVLLTMALLVAAAVFTVQADTPAAYDGTTVCPHCGVAGDQITWVELTTDSYAYAPTEDTHYVVSNPLTVSVNMTFNTDTDVEAVIWVKSTITLAEGKTLRFGNTNAATVAWIVGGGGTITGAGYTNANNGSLIGVYTGGQLHITNDVTIEQTTADVGTNARAGLVNIYRGTVYMKGGTINGYTSSASTTKGGAVYVRNGSATTPSSFIMSGGTINGGTVSAGGAIYSSAHTNVVTIEGNATVNGGTVTNGGAVYMAAGTLNVTGGTINGGAATTGGAIYQYNGATTISGGTINGSAAAKNVASGGALFAYQGSVTMSNGTIQNGYATNGGNVYLSGVTLNMTGGTIQGGNATKMGGNVVMFYRSASGSITAASARLNVNGGTIQNGTVTVAEGTEDIGTYGGGNVYVSRACYLAVDGGTLSGGTVTGGNGGNIFSRGKTTLTTGAITGGSAPNGASIYAYCQSQESNETVHANYAKVVITGGTLTGGTATAAGGAIYLGAYGSADITGGTVTSGTAPKGGNIYMATGTELKISGENTKITSGVSNGGNTEGGGNLYQAGGTVTMSGGTIENGTYAENCRPQGGNIRQDAGTFTMTAGTIRNGSGINLGGNARISGTFNIQGGSVYGGTVESSGGSIGVVGGALNITGGTISGGDGTQAKNASGGGLIYIASGTVKISGDAILENGYATNGGLINHAGGTLTISGGTLQNGKASNKGGNIYSTKQPTLSGGTVTGGDAEDGGNLYLAGGTISGATVSDGTATNGGNIFHASGTLDITAGTISGGEASYGAGIFTYSGALNLVEAADKTLTVTGGEATTYGGVIYAPTSTEGSGDTAVTYEAVITIDLTNGSITGGTAKNGGAIYTATEVNLVKGTITGGATTGNGGTFYLAGGAVVNMNGGTINGGTTEAQGGVAHMPGNTVFNMTGGTINVATTGNGAKGFRIQNGTLNLSGTATINYNGLRIGDAVDVVSTNANNLSTVTLSGGASIVNVGTDDAAAIHLQNYSKNTGRLIVKDDWTGSATIAMEYYSTTSNAEDTITYAGAISTELAEVVDAAEDGIGAFTGELIFRTVSGDPLLFNDGATLYLAKTKIVTEAGNAWYKDNAAAVAAYAASAKPAYILVYTDDALAVGDTEVYVDINGHTVAASGTGKINAFDSTATYTEAGTGKLTGVDVEFYTRNALTGTRYFALGNASEGYVFHAFNIAVSGVSVRPSSAGIYYKATINCDDILKEALDTYGVAVSVAKMPDNQFYLAGSQALYTAIDKADFVSGEAFTGVIINNIMKPGEATNNARAEMPIYANAYVSFAINNEVVTIMADETNQGSTTTTEGFTGIAKDLKSVTKSVDTRYPTLTDAQKESVATMYENFGDVMSGWDLLYVGSADGNPTRELKVLTIGNSLSVDAGRMLAYVASQHNIEITVGTLYYSGCSQAQHVKHLKNNERVYCYYTTHWCADPTCEKIDLLFDYETWQSHTMEDGIKAEKWDVILTSQGLWSSFELSNYNSDMVTLRNYVTGLMTDPANPNANPNFAFGWSMNWVPPVDEGRMATSQDPHPTTGKPKVPDFYEDYKSAADGAEVLDEAAQMIVYNKVVSCTSQKVVASGAYPYFIPSGTLMQNANSSYLAETELYRDYIHASDKMRLATSYLWLCALTGKDLTELCGEDGMITTVPGIHRQAEENQGTDLVLTEDEKAIFEEAITNALTTPLAVTQSQYVAAE